jgi:2-keto-4-pentenoate hydratase/2-oxohepta-3-ene-1,7-dioic acid hydratase in catechol pathway
VKYCRYQADDGVRFGLIETVHGREMIVAHLGELWPGVSNREITQRLAEPVALEEADLRAPIAPPKIVCVGRNYREHAAELGNPLPLEPLIFLKPPSAVIGPGAKIRRPRISERVDHEAELGVIIGRICSRPGEGEDMRSYIHGYTCANDVTARDLQKKDGQWTRGKGFDTFCPIGPVVVTDLDPWAGVAVQCRVNGAVRQDGNTRDFIFPLDHVIRYIAGFMTLGPGDLILTGTPAGVGPLAVGDRVEVSVDGVGTLANTVAAE